MQLISLDDWLLMFYVSASSSQWDFHHVYIMSAVWMTWRWLLFLVNNRALTNHNMTVKALPTINHSLSYHFICFCFLQTTHLLVTVENGPFNLFKIMFTCLWNYQLSKHSWHRWDRSTTKRFHVYSVRLVPSWWCQVCGDTTYQYLRAACISQNSVHISFRLSNFNFLQFFHSIVINKKDTNHNIEGTRCTEAQLMLPVGSVGDRSPFIKLPQQAHLSKYVTKHLLSQCRQN